jgi:carboxyl-terminal processing protease
MIRAFLPLKRSRLTLFVLAVALLSASCKKDPKAVPEQPGTETPPAEGTRSELTKDSIFLYAKEVYLWNDALPSYQQFNPRRYTSGASEIDNYNQELFDITQLKIDPETGRPYEYVSETADFPKYSYITDEESRDPSRTEEVNLEGEGTDFGFTLSGVGTPDSYQIFIRYVNPGSPAAKLGLKRGDVITEVNSRRLGSDFTADVNFINNAFDQQTLNITGRKNDGSIFTRSISKLTYQSSPVFKDTVINSGGKTIGYIAFARFSNPSNALAPLDQAFAEFASAGVTSLVVDLRYNGGGYVSTAEHMINLIAPQRLNGATMFIEYFNETMRSGKAEILKNQPLTDENGRQRFSNGRALTYFDVDYSVEGNTYKFAKKGSLNTVQDVVFIVTGSTASASELVINSLRPHINVRIIGERSYGKPVGFFPINIDVYDVYYSMFQSRNSAGEGDYFQGFAPDASTADDVTHDFGDPAESSFAAAIAYFTQGSFTATSSLRIMGRSVDARSVEIRKMGGGNGFTGMIEDRIRLKAKF